MQQYECQVCGYIYNPELGDERGGVEPGVPFEALPSTWVCPWCDAILDCFRQYEE
ncbi:MAG: rubredoxin [Actinomycetota bacterium]